MNPNPTAAPTGGLLPSSPADRPTRVRYGVLAFCAVLSMITYLDRVCFGTVAPYIRAEFNLTKSELGLLFSAFALAYAAFEVPTGYLGDLFGARKTLIRIVLWWSAFTALTGAIYPSAAYPMLAFLLLLSVRFFFGVGEAGAYPNISRAFASWFPFGERGFAQGAVWMAGRFAGGITPLVVLALVTYSPFWPQGPAAEDAASMVGSAASGPWGALGNASVLTGQVPHWRHMFFLFGGLGLVWCVFFWWWFRDLPTEHASVNAAEIALIQGDQPLAEHDHGNVPWGKLLTNRNLWILCIMYFCCAYGWYFNITWLPTYLDEVYKVKEYTHGFWTVSLMKGMPLLLGSLACLVGGLLTDWFIRRTGDRKWGRRLFGMIGHSVCAACYFMTLTANDPYTFVLWVALAAFWNDITMGAAWASCIDIGGKYAGIVSGCMNTVGNLGGFVAGMATGFILDLAKTPNIGWTINFVSFGVVYVLAVFLWLRFDATKQVPQS